MIDISQVRDHSFFDRGDLKLKVGSQQPSIHNSCTSSLSIDAMRYLSQLTHRHHHVHYDSMNDTFFKIAISSTVSNLQQKEKAGRNKTTEMGGQPTSAFT